MKLGDLLGGLPEPMRDAVEGCFLQEASGWWLGAIGRKCHACGGETCRCTDDEIRKRWAHDPR